MPLNTRDRLERNYIKDALNGTAPKEKLPDRDTFESTIMETREGLKILNDEFIPNSETTDLQTTIGEAVPLKELKNFLSKSLDGKDKATAIEAAKIAGRLIDNATKIEVAKLQASKSAWLGGAGQQLRGKKPALVKTNLTLPAIIPDRKFEAPGPVVLPS